MTPKKKPQDSVETEVPADYINQKILKLSMTQLVPHEGILDWHLKELKDWIERDGFQARPIAVSSLKEVGPEWRDKFMIHDGHHRSAALMALRCSFVMASVFDFSDPRIRIFDYDTASVPIPKEVVVKRAVEGREIIPRFDKHFIEVEGRLLPFHDNPILEPEVRTRLSDLRK